MKLLGKTAIVTGAASGMGKAIAELFAKEGANVIVSDMNIEGAEKVVEGIKANNGQAYAVQTNVTNDEDLTLLFDTTLSQYGQLDILVNNAGIMDGMEPVGELTDELWERVMAVNTTAVMKTMRKAVALFMDQQSGVIINNISAGGLYGGRAGAAYTASKHAVSGLTRNTAFMYGAENIRCNGIAPGGIETNIGSTMKNISEFGFARQSLGMALSPRIGQPSEVAEMALFLASDASSFVNGQIITVDGGWTNY